MPDFILCVRGFFVSIELKTDTGEASELQKHNIRKIKKFGGISFIMTPDTYMKEIERLKSFAQGGDYDGDCD